ncbi:N-acetyltransferase [Planotetraspora thailandica]|uniref:N-acetyltransferase n=1 Tax=Planotetraspora thailandica TaxID=487172 RepID=A0A8J3UYF9_9ACTN|nr:GNAT family N-acetyltransferase [Planotetraspora thailandica]GII52152.1 N-acetyltransferase [Planotetraspora thailandica]
MTTGIARVENAAGAAEKVGAVIAESFHDLAVSTWLVPPDEDRRRVLPAQFSMLTEHALAHGEVYATDDMSAVAVWFHNDGTPPPEIPGEAERVAAFAGRHSRRLAQLDTEMAKHHPHDPHHYLAFLAVVPERQGQGLGTRLLAEHHAALDGSGVAAYLEASNARSREFYLRHGYSDLGTPLILPDGPPMFPMWRPPGS